MLDTRLTCSCMPPVMLRRVARICALGRPVAITADSIGSQSPRQQALRRCMFVDDALSHSLRHRVARYVHSRSCISTPTLTERTQPKTAAAQSKCSVTAAAPERHREEESDSSGPPSSSGRTDFCVVNFYHLVTVEEPQAEIQKHREWLEARNISGRIYITHQGINAQLSGPQEDAHAYAAWVSKQPVFQGLWWTSDPTDGHQFPRLRLKYKENLVQLAGGTRNLPITNEQARAEPLAPAEWKEMLQNAKQSRGTDIAPVVLDVRNGYEWDAGHFEGAARPTEEQFNQTPTSEVPPQLEGALKDTPILMYCTGGIRCDIYSAYLRQQGYKKLFTLQGGVANYLREMGTIAWSGSLFTFDNRLAVSPDGKCLRDGNLSAAAPCCGCGGVASLPHMNCANIDCNRLFLACPQCQERLKGCCCVDCVEGPRFVRPRKSEGHYKAWHSMTVHEDLERVKEAMRSGRGSGRAAKRARRIERLRAKHAEARQVKMERRQQVKSALAAMRAEESESEDMERDRVQVVA